MPIGPTDDAATAQRTATIVQTLTGADDRCTEDTQRQEDDDA